MTETPPIAVLMLSSSTQRAQCRQWLTTDSPCPGTVLEEDLAGLDLMGTGDGDPATAPDSPDVVLLDQAIYDARWPQLQARWPSPRPAFALLLADEDESLAQTAIAAGIDDYLIDSQLTGTRLRQTLKLLGQRTQWQRTLVPGKGQDTVGSTGGDVATEGAVQSPTALVAQASEAHFEAIYHQAAVGICLAETPSESTTPGRIIAANQWFCQFLGYSEAELQHMTDDDYSHPDDLAPDWPVMQSLLTGQRSYFSMEKRFIHKSGEIRWAIVTISLVRDAQGQPRHNIAIVQDISDRKQAERALRASERRYAALTEMSPIGIFRFDAAGECVYVNPRWCEMTGRTLETASGDDWVSLLHPDDRDRILTSWGVAFEQQMPYVNEGRHIHTNGTVVWNDLRMMPEFDDQGELLGYVGTVADISDRKQAEFALRESERRFATLTESAPVGIFRFDATGQLLYVNPTWCQMTGCTLEAARGDGWVNVLHPDDRDRLLNLWTEALPQRSPYQTEGRVLHADGSIVWFDLRMMPEFDAEGQFQGYIGTVADITSNKAAEAALQESEMRFRQIAETVREGFFVIDLKDPSEPIYTYTNPALAVIAGYPPENFVATEQLWLDHIHPDDRPRIAIALERLTQGEAYDEEYRYRRPDGELLWLRSQAFPIADNQGTFASVVGIVEDITDRKQTEIALRTSQAWLHTAMTAAKMGSWNWNFASNEVVWSESLERLMGLEPGTFDGAIETVTAMIHPEDRQPVFDAVNRAVEQGEYYSIGFRFIKPDGSVRWVDSKGDVVRDADGTVIGIAGVDIDITDRKQAEIQLEAATQRLQLATNSAEIGIWDYDIAGDQLFWDDRMYDLYGLTRTSTVAPYATWENSLHPDDRDRAAAELQAAIRGEQDFHTEFRVLWSDGQVRYIEAHAITTRDAEGKALRMIGVNWDITNRKQAEAALKKSEADLLAAQRLAHVGNWEYDLETQVVSWSDELYYLYGQDKTQWSPSLTKFKQQVPPEDWGAFEQALPQAINEGIPYTIEHRVIRSDGDIRYAVSKGQAVRFPQGKVVKLFGTTQDITAAKQAELALQASERRYATLAENSPNAVFRFNAEGQCVYVNPRWCEMTGRTVEEGYGDDWIQVLHPEDRDHLLADLQEAFAQKKSLRNSGRHLLPDGSVIWFDAQIVPEFDCDGNFLGFVGTLTDITETKQAELALRASESRFKQLAEAVPGVIYTLTVNADQSAQFDYLSPAFEAIHEIPIEWAYQDITQLLNQIHPDDWPNYERATQASWETLQLFDEECRFIMPSGQVKWLQVRFKPTPRNDRIEVHGIVLDISDRKRAELALQRREAQLQRLTSNVAGVIYQYVLHPDGTDAMTYISPKCREIYELEPEDILQNAGLVWDLIHLDDLAAAQQAVMQSAQNLETFDIEFRIQLASGRLKWLRAVAQPERQQNGSTLWDGFVLDVTDRKQAEQALKQLNEELEQRVQERTAALARSEQDLRTIFNNVYDAIFIHDLDGTILDVNDRALELHGATRAQLVGASVADISSDAAPVSELAAIFQRVQQGETVQFEWVSRRFDTNRSFNVEVSLRQVTLDQQTVVIAGVRDISDRKQAEIALQESRNMLELVLNAIPQRVFWKDRNSVYLGCNLAFANDYQLTPTDIPGKVDLDLFDAERAHLYGEEDQQILSSTRRKLNYEEQMNIAAGEQRWQQTSKVPLTNAQGEVVGILGCYDDISDRKRAVQALQDREARLQATFDQAAVGMVWINLDGSLQAVNQKICAIMGYTEADLLTQHFLDITHPDDIAADQALTTRMLAGEIDSFRLEKRYCHKAGHIVWANLSVGLIRTPTGEPQAWLAVVEDISDRKQLEAQQQRLLDILEASPDQIGIATVEGQVLWNNRQAKLARGWPLDIDVTQIPISAYHPPWAAEILLNEGMPAAKRDGFWVGETAFLNADNQEIPVSQLVVAHRNRQGEVDYISTIVRDISALKQAEQRLKQANADLEARVRDRTADLIAAKEEAEAANQAKSTFLANMSHELRTPLNAILGFSELMGRDPTLSPCYRDNLAIINRSGDHLLTLINDILEMSKIEAGQLTLTPTNFAVDELLADLIDLLRLKAEAKGLAFSLDRHPQVPSYIRADSHKLRQVLLNLLSNAIKFTEVGYVTLRLEPGTPEVLLAPQDTAAGDSAIAWVSLRFVVEDSGVGVAADELDALFEPFVQTASGRYVQEGTGLGLPISQKFVQLLGGQLEVTSQLDQGSTFWFEIPVGLVRADDVEGEEPAARVQAIAPGQPQHRILVVEDHWANRVLLQTLLTTVGFEVMTANDGQAAIACWQTWQPDLIFMDIRMPVMDGIEATREIRRQEQADIEGSRPPTKIISLTAGILAATPADLIELGFDDCIVKPIQERVITQTLATHLGVTYLYDPAALPPFAAEQQPRQPLTAETLQVLPLAWIQQFYQAIVRLDETQMLALIAEVADAQPDLAQHLTHRVQNFDYDLLLNLCQLILGMA
jgi:PAS domain S-box-containing protein